jgi:hypothetical protein
MVGRRQTAPLALGQDLIGTMRNPTLPRILMSCEISFERKLEVVASMSQALSYQHEVALRRRDPRGISQLTKPRSIALDVATGAVYWDSAGHSALNSGKGLHDCMVRAVETFILGVSAHFEEQVAKVVETVCDNYEHTPVLISVSKKMDAGETGWGLRLAGPLGYEKKRNKQYRQISAALGAWVERWQSRSQPGDESDSIEILQLMRLHREKISGFGNRRTS